MLEGTSAVEPLKWHCTAQICFVLQTQTVSHLIVMRKLHTSNEPEVAHVKLPCYFIHAINPHVIFFLEKIFYIVFPIY